MICITDSYNMISGLAWVDVVVWILFCLPFHSKITHTYAGINLSLLIYAYMAEMGVQMPSDNPIAITISFLGTVSTLLSIIAWAEAYFAPLIVSTLLGPVWLSCKKSIQNWIYKEEGINVSDLTIIIISFVLLASIIIIFVVLSRTIFVEAASNILINIFYSVMMWMSVKFLYVKNISSNNNNTDTTNICCEFGLDADKTPNCPLYISNLSIIIIIFASILRITILFTIWRPPWVRIILERKELKKLRKQQQQKENNNNNNEKKPLIIQEQTKGMLNNFSSYYFNNNNNELLSPIEDNLQSNKELERRHLQSYPNYRMHQFPDI